MGSVVLLVALSCGLALALSSPAPAGMAAGGVISGLGVADASPSPRSLGFFLSPAVLFALFVLVGLSAFFSSSETAFLAIPRPRLRSMREEQSVASRLIVLMLDHPGRLLTTILVGNTVVNVLISVILGSRVAGVFEEVVGLPSAAAYAATVATCTFFLLIFGEITPKIIAVRMQESYARLAVFPLLVADRVLAPLRRGLLGITDFLFRVTRFHELHAAPFITDEELKAVLSGESVSGAVSGSMEEEGRQMIRRILEFREATIREVLVPRTDVVAIPEGATVGEALAAFREHEYSRMPLYRDDLDHVTGVLYAKDLLPSVHRGELSASLRDLVRPPHFVPETMSIQAFVEDAQRLRVHLAIVVDEYGGTEGIITLQDAIEEVVGDISDEHDEDEPLLEQLDEGTYRVPGSLHLDELSDLIGVPVEDEEHETVAGFLMDRTERIPAVGDEILHSGVTFRVESVEGKRASTVRVELSADNEKEGAQ